MSEKAKTAPVNFEAQNATLKATLETMQVELAAQRADSKLAREREDAMSARLEAQEATANASAAAEAVRTLGRAGYRFKSVTEAVALAAKNPDGFKAHMALLEPDPGLKHGRTFGTGANPGDEPGDVDPTVQSKQEAANEFIAARRAGKSSAELKALGAKLEAACAKEMYR